MLRVIEESTQLSESGGTIIVESDKAGADGYTEIADPSARNLAIQYAASRGVVGPGISGNVRPFPVDDSGREITDPRTQKLAAVRGEIPVTRRLV